MPPRIGALRHRCRNLAVLEQTFQAAAQSPSKTAAEPDRPLISSDLISYYQK